MKHESDKNLVASEQRNLLINNCFILSLSFSALSKPTVCDDGWLAHHLRLIKKEKKLITRGREQNATKQVSWIKDDSNVKKTLVMEVKVSIYY